MNLVQRKNRQSQSSGTGSDAPGDLYGAPFGDPPNEREKKEEEKKGWSLCEIIIIVLCVFMLGNIAKNKHARRTQLGKGGGVRQMFKRVNIGSQKATAGGDTPGGSNSEVALPSKEKDDAVEPKPDAGKAKEEEQPKADKPDTGKAKEEEQPKADKPDTGEAKGEEQPKAGDSRWPPGCRWDCYIDRHKDLKKRLKYTEKAAIGHWLGAGSKKGRKCTCDFKK